MKTFTHFAKGLRITLPAALLLLATSATVWGNTLTQFALNGNNAVCGCSENVEADFTALANGDLQVVLTNSIDTYVDRQILTGIQFRFAGSGNSAGTVTSQTPDGNTLYNITNSTGVLTRTSASLTAWSTQLDLSPYVTLTNLGVSGVHGGGEGILGSATSGAVNNLSQHDPLVLGAATFLLHGIAGVDASTIITGVNFNFGTALNDYVAGSVVNSIATSGLNAQSATPEPGTTALLTGGLLLFATGRLRRRRA